MKTGSPCVNVFGFPLQNKRTLATFRQTESYLTPLMRQLRHKVSGVWRDLYTRFVCGETFIPDLCVECVETITRFVCGVCRTLYQVYGVYNVEFFIM